MAKRNKKRILKIREENSYIQGNPIRLSADFSAETLQAPGSDVIQSTERKKPKTKNAVSNKIIIQD